MVSSELDRQSGHTAPPQGPIYEKSSAISSQTELAATVAHEVKNIATPVRGYIQLLQEDVTQHRWDDALRHSRFVLGELDHLLCLVHQWMQPIGVQFTSGYRLIEIPKRVGELLHYECAARNVTMSLNIPTELPSVAISADLLYHSLLNVCTNALEASPPYGEVTVTVRAASDDVEIAVHDQGGFIPNEDLAKIFEPFYTTKPTGNGLGLSFALRTIRESGGDICCTCSPEAGTTFTIRLPIAKPVDK